jgi:hypothetical protein
MSRKQKKQQSKLVSVSRKVLERILLALLVVVCIGAFYLAVILAEVPADQGAPAQSPAPQVTLTAEQPRQISSLNDIAQLAEHFPSPVLALTASTELSFSGGVVNDLAYKGSYARLITLTYQTQNGETLKLYSIYPPDAFTLLPGEGYTLQDRLTASLAGMTAVRMENADMIRLHVKGESALYALTAPRMDEELLSEISRQAMLVKP